jgi:hypothetical protein
MFARLSSVVMLQERPHFYDRHVAGNINKILNIILLIFRGLFTRKDHLTHHNIIKYIYFHDSYQ